MTQLPLTIRPAFGEPVHGAVVRLAARHGMEYNAEFTQLIGIDFREVFMGRNLEQIASLSSLSAPDLKFFSAIPHANLVASLAGQKVLRGDWTHSVRRVCPQCIRNDKQQAKKSCRDPDSVIYHRAYWDLLSIPQCVDHGLELIQQCTVCNVPLSWKDGSIRYCINGCDLTKTETIRTPNGICRASRYFAARLGFGTKVKHKLLDKIDYRHAVILCGRLGALDERGWRRSPGERDRSKLQAHIKAGFRLMEDYPASINELLDRIVSQSWKKNPAKGMIPRYGYLYNSWLKGEANSFMSSIATVTRRHAIKNRIIHPNETILANAGEQSDTITFKELGKMFNSSHVVCRRRLKAANLLTNAVRRGAPLAIDRVRAIEAMSKSLENRLEQKPAAEKLGISVVSVRKLLSNGYIKRLGRNVDERSIPELLNDLKSAASKIGDDRKPRKPRKFNAGRGSRNLVAIIKHVLSGDLAVWIETEEVTDLGSFVVDLEEISAYFQPKNHINLRDASKIMKIHSECMSALVKYGEIKRLNGRAISRQSLELFMQTYVSTPSLAAKFDLKRKTIRCRLEQCGIKPAFNRPKYRTLIFRKSNIPTAAFSRTLTPTAK